ncbi:alpha/beta fold hydrolase [Bernardetia sp.]|uniref:alpha/beta fold hydrolase n=1 Tax=Bernardetia sp. TaxID=1937974 RepID=UPI0025C6679D|nr:alpha/beta fold hydrolase [Bernardetia sp.]
MPLKYESFFIDLKNESNDILHLKRIHKQEIDKEKLQNLPSILLIHGSVENGRIFYSENEKGLGSYLAQNGFDVFVADLRGKGKSTPNISKYSTFGQTEYILEDLPAFANKVREIKGSFPMYWGAHSWGGVMIPPFMIRFPQVAEAAKKMVFFGSKRRIRTKGREKIVKIDLVWNVTGKILSKTMGYFPNTKFKFGTDNESREFIRESNRWIYEDKWLCRDSFDYQKAFQQLKNEKKYFPKTLHIAAINDTILGNPNDVKLLKEEMDNEKDEFWLLSKENQNLHDYDHNNMLTHKDAANDHFPKIVEWLK